MSKDFKRLNHLTKKEDRIPLLQLAAYGFGGIIPIALFNIAGQLMGLIGNISLGLSALWLGVILIIPRLWDAISDPIVGHITDNARTRWGRRRPFLLIGGIAVAISFVLMWWIPDGELVHSWFPSDISFQWFQLGYILFWLLIFFTACTIFEIPHGALGMEMSTDYHERTRLFSAKSFLGNLFAMSTPWLFALANMEYFKGPGGNEADGMRYVSMVIAVILIPLSFWWFFTVKEPGFKITSKQKKEPFWKNMKHTISNKTFLKLVIIIFTLAIGFNFVNLLGYYIPIFYIFNGDKAAASTLLGINGTVWAITGLIAVFPLNWISSRLGKRKTLIIAIVLMCLAQLSKIYCYNQDYPYLVIIPTILLSAGMLFFFTLGSSMVGDICDEDDLKTGRRSEGSYYSIFWWFIKMGTALASFVAGVLIVFTQFDENQVTKVDALQGAVNEVQTKIISWTDYEKIADKSTYEVLEKAKVIITEALKESKDYLSLLKIENLKKKEQFEDENNSILKKEQEIIVKGIYNIEVLVEKQEQINLELKQLNTNNSSSEIKNTVGETVSITLESGLSKARINTSLLQLHIEKKSLENSNSNEHYQKLKADIGEVEKLLLYITTLDDLELINIKIKSLKEKMKLLTQQAPYTLFMMRAVEIGLPLLLSIISIFFAMRYSLSEERCYEIKEALKKRNEIRLKNS